MKRVFLVGITGSMAIAVAGCSLAPRSFRDLLHPAPIVRARAMGMDEKQPEGVAIPSMIARLNDPDRVVRMTANDGLKERTHRDFGFVAWASSEERSQAIRRWQAWWDDRRAQAGFPKDAELRKVAARPDRRRRKGRKDVQGGTSTWPTAEPMQSPP